MICRNSIAVTGEPDAALPFGSVRSSETMFNSFSFTRSQHITRMTGFSEKLQESTLSLHSR
ncbi:MAG: hypothetical protein E7535_11325 [Ruminococcaceae bacterium]|nr:hypothetical protein [Oscillospiraceae bacterium]